MYANLSLYGNKPLNNALGNPMPKYYVSICKWSKQTVNFNCTSNQ